MSYRAAGAHAGKHRPLQMGKMSDANEDLTP